MKFTTGTSCTNANKWICTKRQRTGEDLHHFGPDTLAVVAAQPDMDDLAALMARGRDHDGNIQPGVAGEEGAGEGSLQQNVVFATSQPASTSRRMSSAMAFISRLRACFSRSWTWSGKS